jgi:RNA polymerase sigma-70 factor (ECF subfamily)
MRRMSCLERSFPDDGETLANVNSGGWDRLIESVNPAAMIVRIHGRMSSRLHERMTAEDVWQETLLHAWRDREQVTWRGPKEFRRWILQVAENRIRDAADRETAAKRGDHVTVHSVRAGATTDSFESRGTGSDSPFSSTTPSRVAIAGEEAAAIRRALESLPDLVRDVVRLRLFEELGLDEIAKRVGISHAAVKHRLRDGSALYRERLRTALRSSGLRENP